MCFPAQQNDPVYQTRRYFSKALREKARARAAPVEPNENGSSEQEESEDPRTWKMGLITGNMVLRDEKTGKTFVVPYDVARLKEKFSSSKSSSSASNSSKLQDGKGTQAHTLRTPIRKHAVMSLALSPDMSQSVNSPSNVKWKDEVLKDIDDEIKGGKLKATALELLSEHDRLNVTCERWSDGSHHQYNNTHQDHFHNSLQNTDSARIAIAGHGQSYLTPLCAVPSETHVSILAPDMARQRQVKARERECVCLWPRTKVSVQYLQSCVFSIIVEIHLYHY